MRANKLEFQAQILTFLEGIRNDFLTTFFTSITILAEKVFLVLILCILYWCIDKARSKRIAWFVLFGTVGNGVVKNIVRMPRPYDLGVVKPLRVETATSYSFPSGHTQSATSFWAGSMIILKTKASVLLGSIIILLTALSRLYLGVHWPMDVLGAIGFGLICLYFANQLINESGEVNKWHVIGSSILCLVTFVLPGDSDYYNAVALLWGFCIGAYVEQVYIQFEVTSDIKRNIERAIIGLIGIVLIYIGIGQLLPDVQVISMIKNALVVFWMIAGAPYVFKRLKK